jgi:perosamine synthetase
MMQAAEALKAPDIELIVRAIAQVVATRSRPVPLHEPKFAGREWSYLKECLDTGWVSSVGKFVDRFETDLAQACGARHAVAMVNGTAALHMALHIAGVRRDDEVIAPALTFVATPNAITHCGATPHFVDCEERNLGMDPRKLAVHLREIAERTAGGAVNRQTGRRIAAVVPVHIFGHPCDMSALLEVCGAYELPVIEDATESLGSTYRGRPCGSFGLMGVLSFNGNKIITTGGGGAIVCNDAVLAKRAKHVSSTAKLPHKCAFLHDEVGWNYRMPNINAALGVAQLEMLPNFIQAKRRLAHRYGAAFAGMPGVRWVEEPTDTSSNYWLNAILLDDDSGASRDALLQATHAAGLLTRPAWTLMHRLPMYANCPRADLTVSESIEHRLVNLPSSAALGQE